MSLVAKLFLLSLLGATTLFAGEPPKVLIVGGGSSHDFNKWFNQADVATLSEGGKATVTYTDKVDTVLGALKDIDVLYLSANQPLAHVELRKGIFDFADSGKGLLLVHPALWYNWGDWPEYNKVLAGGGSKGHDKLGEFEVSVDDAKHPIMKDVPATFKIIDELYYFTRDEKGGTPIEVLATGKSPLSGKTFPVVFVVKHPKTRIVGITLGHDGRAHESAAYKTILKNALEWVAQK
ncbi:MAG TPA: ThuA domain-containing protein [Planctomycetota bacterium]|nr:ThuA domain-containing protein [Planctomycetota bacterium]